MCSVGACQKPKGTVAQARNKSNVERSLVHESDQVVSHAAVLLDLKSKMDVMERFMIGMAKEQITGSQGRQTSKFNEFQMWLLPMKKKEIMVSLQISKTAVLFIRRDFSHAGACMQRSTRTQCIFSQAEAGWDYEKPYWHPSRIEPWRKDPAIFLSPDYRCPPFGWPQLSKRTPSGAQIITYPADLTNDLLPPEKRTQPVKKKKLSVKEDHKVKKEKHNMEDS